MLKRPHYMALGLVLLLTLVTLNLPSQTTARLKLAIGALFLPLFGLANASQQALAQAGDAITPRGELLKQNEAYRRENQQLRLQAMQAEEIARENDRLRKLQDWAPQKRWRPKLAKVVLREPANWWRTLQIDLGSRDGMSNDLPVLTPKGFLVGRLASVSLTRSQVLLLGDPNCHISAIVENEARDMGVIGASGPLDDTLVDMTYLPRNATIKPGQNVVTSGQGGVFPPAIPIGKVVDAHPADYGLNLVARVKLAGNLSALEEVWVLLK